MTWRTGLDTKTFRRLLPSRRPVQSSPARRRALAMPVLGRKNAGTMAMTHVPKDHQNEWPKATAIFCRSPTVGFSEAGLQRAPRSWAAAGSIWVCRTTAKTATPSEPPIWRMMFVAVVALGTLLVGQVAVRRGEHRHHAEAEPDARGRSSATAENA